MHKLEHELRHHLHCTTESYRLVLVTTVCFVHNLTCIKYLFYSVTYSHRFLVSSVYLRLSRGHICWLCCLQVGWSVKKC